MPTISVTEAQFLAIARDEGLDLQTGEIKPGSIQRCVLAGFPDQVAVRLDAGTVDAKQAAFGRLQTGSLHLYAWFVLVGIVGTLLWSWRHV